MNFIYLYPIEKRDAFVEKDFIGRVQSNVVLIEARDD
jgi:hypothetical protein